MYTLVLQVTASLILGIFRHHLVQVLDMILKGLGKDNDAAQVD